MVQLSGCETLEEMLLPYVCPIGWADQYHSQSLHHSLLVMQRYIEQHGPPATRLITSAYYEKYLRWYQFWKLPDGTYRLSTNVGTNAFAQNTVKDIGLCAAGATLPLTCQLIRHPDVVLIVP